MISIEQINKCIAVAKRYGVRRITLFGSAAKDPAHARDIDILCDGVSGIQLLKMAADMENETGAQVDTVSGDQPTAFVEYNRVRGMVIYDAARS